jgi:hypothetical protein
MIFKGERAQAGVSIAPVDKSLQVAKVSELASDRIAQEIRQSICIGCEIFETECKGAGDIHDNGMVRERVLSSKKIPTVVKHESCQIPNSTIPSLDEGIEVVPKKIKSV